MFGLLFVAMLAHAGISLGVLWRGVPQPCVHDEFVYLLQADTYARGRLANPSPALPEFFESFHLIVEPTYAGKYPPAQGLLLALGMICGHPFLGVWLSAILMAVSITWALQAVVRPGWALWGGAFCALHFTICHAWGQSYWGGALPAIGGALVLGATLRLWTKLNWKHAWICGSGAALLMFSRPFEGFLFCLVPAATLLLRAFGEGVWRRHTWTRLIVPAIVPILAAGAFMLLVNQRVTGNFWRLPYTEYEEQYSGQPLFVWQKAKPAPVFTRGIQERYYKEFVVIGSRFAHPLPVIYLDRMAGTVFYYAGGAAAFAVVGILLIRTDRKLLITTLAILASSLAFVLSYWHQPHYQAATLASFLALLVAGAQWLTDRGVRSVSVAVLAGLLAIGGSVLQADVFLAASANLRRFAGNRAKALAHLSEFGGRHLVFVHKDVKESFHAEWVYNSADLADAPVVWAHDLGPEKNARLIALYPERRAWRLADTKTSIEIVPLGSAPGGAKHDEVLAAERNANEETLERP